MLQTSKLCNKHIEKQRPRFSFWVKILKKNHEKMNDLKLIQNHSRKVLRASGHQKTSWNIILTDPGPSGKNSKIRQKLVILRSFGTQFYHFRHADACVALRRASRVITKWLVEHIPVLYRVTRRQPGTSLKFSIKWHLEDFWGSKCWVWEIWPFVCDSETFSSF